MQGSEVGAPGLSEHLGPESRKGWVRRPRGQRGRRHHKCALRCLGTSKHSPCPTLQPLTLSPRSPGHRGLDGPQSYLESMFSDKTAAGICPHQTGHRHSPHKPDPKVGQSSPLKHRWAGLKGGRCTPRAHIHVHTLTCTHICTVTCTHAHARTCTVPTNTSSHYPGPHQLPNYVRAASRPSPGSGACDHGGKFPPALLTQPSARPSLPEGTYQRPARRAGSSGRSVLRRLMASQLECLVDVAGMEDKGAEPGTRSSRASGGLHCARAAAETTTRSSAWL